MPIHRYRNRNSNFQKIRLSHNLIGQYNRLYTKYVSHTKPVLLISRSSSQLHSFLWHNGMIIFITFGDISCFVSTSLQKSQPLKYSLYTEQSTHDMSHKKIAVLIHNCQLLKTWLVVWLSIHPLTSLFTRDPFYRDANHNNPQVTIFRGNNKGNHFLLTLKHMAII